MQLLGESWRKLFAQGSIGRLPCMMLKRLFDIARLVSTLLTTPILRLTRSSLSLHLGLFPAGGLIWSDHYQPLQEASNGCMSPLTSSPSGSRFFRWYNTAQKRQFSSSKILHIVSGFLTASSQIWGPLLQAMLFGPIVINVALKSIMHPWRILKLTDKSSVPTE